MSSAGNIISVSPRYVIPGGEVYIDCEGFEVGELGTYGCFVGGVACKLIGASSRRIVSNIKKRVEQEHTNEHLERGS